MYIPKHVRLQKQPKTAEGSREREDLQYTTSIRIAKVPQIKALEAISSHSSDRRILRRVRQVELTTTAFKSLWDKGEQGQLDLESIEDCLGDDVEELIL
ncbi:hypothetical protein IAR50_001063 [Cryptococcus sp. DSM 104548]